MLYLAIQLSRHEQIFIKPINNWKIFWFQIECAMQKPQQKKWLNKKFWTYFQKPKTRLSHTRVRRDYSILFAIKLLFVHVLSLRFSSNENEYEKYLYAIRPILYSPINFTLEHKFYFRQSPAHPFCLSSRLLSFVIFFLIHRTKQPPPSPSWNSWCSCIRGKKWQTFHLNGNDAIHSPSSARAQRILIQISRNKISNSMVYGGV